MAFTTANIPDRAHSELKFHKYYGDDLSMHETASPEMIAEFQKKYPRDFYCFGIPREFPVARFDLPAGVMLLGAVGELEKLRLTGRPGEFLAFQIAVWSPGQALGNLHLECGSFPLPVRVFLQENEQKINLSAGRIQVFWCMIDLPDTARTFHGNFTVTADGFSTVAIPCALTVAGERLTDGGESDDSRLARLRWLDSEIGISHEVPEPYLPLRRKGLKLFMFGRTLTLSPEGLPESAESFFCGSNDRLGTVGKSLLSRPFAFVPDGEFPAAASGSFCRFTVEAPDRIEWRSGCRFAGCGAELSVSGFLEYDGFASFDCSIRFSKECSLNDLRLEFSASGCEFIGLNRHGGPAPDKLRWLWDTRRNQDGFWLGDLNGGIRLRLRDRSSRIPLTNCYYHFSPITPPPAWDNGGKGGIALTKCGGISEITAFSGARKVTAGTMLDYGFELQLTPFKPADPVRHLKQRFFHPYMHDLELPLEKMFTPEFFSRLRAEGVEVINLHHALKENPFINLPYTAASLPYLQQFVEQAHREELKVCLYYTIRELSVHAPEFWAFAAMRGEILFPGPGNEARPETAPMGAHPYLQTNCRFGYLSAWAEAVKEGPHAGELDLAVETAPGRRFENYYLEGLRYLLERCPIDGLYLDDISLSREGFRRLGTIFRSIRKCEPILNLHSWNSYNPRFPNYGNASPVLRDLHFYPFLSSLWIGEAFDYEGTSPDYYLTEISGLPFGLMSEMLDRGGNPWRGMLFAMTGRLGWLADPRPLWKLFDSFDLAHSRMITFCDAAPAVRCSAPAVKATLFLHPGGRALLAAASWSPHTEKVRFRFDVAQLPENLRNFRTLNAMEINGMQTAERFDADAEIPVEPGRGILLLLEE